MIISGPTQVKHNIHGTFDNTGKIVITRPKMKASELKKENEVMHILAAQLYSFASDTDGCSTYKNECRYLTSKNVKFREFTERINFTAHVLSTMRRDKLLSNHTIEGLNKKIEEMKNEIYILQEQLTESRQSKEKEIKANILLEQQKFQLRNERDRSEKELSILKSRQYDNESLRKKIISLCSDLKQNIKEMRTENFELQKENERLKRDLQHLGTEVNNLNKESTTTRKKLSWTGNRSPRSMVKESVEYEEEEENEGEECSNQQTARGKQVHYNFTASSVNFIEQSSLKYGQRGDETD